MPRHAGHVAESPIRSRTSGKLREMKAMILAAGRGERMGALTSSVPKPLLEVSGEALIERHLRRLAAAGIADVVINLSYRGAQVRARLGSGERYGVRIRYSEEGEPPLESAGGIVHALPLLGDQPFLLVNADIFTEYDFRELIDAVRTAREEPGWRGTLVLVPNPPHNATGDFGLSGAGASASAARGKVTSTPPLFTYSGIACYDAALFASLASGRRALKPILDAALADGALDARFYDGLWLDIGTPERLAQARARLEQRR